MQEQSSKCQKKTEVYSRVVGFFRPVNQWNLGKKEEFKVREVYRGYEDQVPATDVTH